MERRKYNQGLTLVEILLVVGIIAIIAGISVPFYRNFQSSQELDIASKDMLLNLRDAQNRARSGQDDSVWGVHFNAGFDEHGIFRGTEFSSYYDDPVSIPGVLSVTSNFGTDITFTKALGAPSASGAVTLEGEGGESRQIEITEVGLINLN